MIDDIKRAFEERGIRKVKVGGFDIDGVLRGKYISPAKFFASAEKGFGFCDVVFGWDITDALYDNAKVTGWKTGYPDTHAQIDLSTFRVLPYESDTAHFLVDFQSTSGNAHPACPRGLLKSIAKRAETLGYSAKFGAEFEFWIFDETPTSLHEKSFHDLQTLSPGMFGYSWVRQGQHQTLVHDIIDTMNAYDIDIEGLHTETGPGVWEACLHYDDVVAAADKAALFKTTLKQICHRHGLSVTFMAKWNADLPGSSGHLHQSLWSDEGEKNVFSGDGGKLSETGRHYLGGLVTSAPEFTAFYSPLINSYKRYVPGVWAPLTASWGVDNRTCAVRLIEGDSQSATRIEYRQTAADINPYIAMAACLGAGLYGIEHSVEPPPATMGDATQPSETQPALPTSLAEALRLLQQSERARDILGEGFVDHYARTRDWEVRAHERSVSDWELKRYFEAT